MSVAQVSVAQLFAINFLYKRPLTFLPLVAFEKYAQRRNINVIIDQTNNTVLLKRGNVTVVLPLRKHVGISEEDSDIGVDLIDVVTVLWRMAYSERDAPPSLAMLVLDIVDDVVEECTTVEEGWCEPIMTTLMPVVDAIANIAAFLRAVPVTMLHRSPGKAVNLAEKPAPFLGNRGWTRVLQRSLELLEKMRMLMIASGIAERLRGEDGGDVNEEEE